MGMTLAELTQAIRRKVDSEMEVIVAESIAEHALGFFGFSNRIIDNALGSFVKSRVEIDQSNDHGVLRAYQDNDAIKKRFPDGYKVRMGYGLHVGWAIEGAIGCDSFRADNACCYVISRVVLFCHLESHAKNACCSPVPRVHPSNFIPSFCSGRATRLTHPTCLQM